MKNLLTLTLLFLLMFGSVAGQNQADYWETQQAPYGGDVLLTKTSNGHLYARHRNVKRAIYRSNDNGGSWEELTSVTHSLINFTSLYLGEAGNFYYKTARWYRSSNEGLSWDTLSAAATPMTNIVETSLGTLLGFSKDTIYRSIDGGQQWVIASTAPVNEVKSLESIVTTPWGGLIAKILYQAPAAKKVFFRSTDDGQTWQRYEVGSAYTLSFIAPSGTFFFHSSLNKLFRSTDGGQTLTEVSTFSTIGVVFNALPTGRLLRIYTNKLYYSDDDGISWQSLNGQFGNGSALQALQAIPPLADSTIFCTILSSIHKSKDGGQTWNFSSNGIGKPETFDFQFFSDSVYYVSTTNGLWRTANAGFNWNRILERNTIHEMANFEKTSGGGLVVSINSNLYYSSNALDSFTAIGDPHFISGMKFFINPSNDHLFLNGTQGFLRSFNLGQNWESTPFMLIKEMLFHPSGRMIGLNNNNKNLLLTDDEGLTWTTVTIPNVTTIFNLWLKPDGSLLTEVKDGVDAYFMKSTDAGESWIATGGKHPHALNGSISAVDANGHLYTVDAAQIMVSVNDGINWQTTPYYYAQIPYPEYNWGIYQLDITPDQHLFINSYNYDHYRSVQAISEGAYIKGQIRRDADADCSTADAQTPLNNTIVKAGDDQYEYLTTTDPGGQYVFFVDTGTYNVAAISANQVWWDYCDNPQTVVLTELLSTDTADFAAIALSDCPLIAVNFGAPTLRRCFQNPVYVQYCNRGTEPADSAWVDVILDPYLSFTSSAQAHNDLGNNIIRFFIGDIESGDCGQFQLTVFVDCDSTILGQTHCITAHGFPDTLCTTVPNWSGANIEASVICQDTVVQFELQNTGPAASQILNYIIIEDDVVMFQGLHQYQPGQTFSMPIPANGHTYRIESEQEPGHPFSTRALAFEEGCGGFETLGFINQFTVNGITPSWHRVCRENTGSFDPNDKQGLPSGTGAEHKIRPGQAIEYTIRFQNTGTDTAFTVLLRDTLSPWLDPASIVPGAASHPYSWQLNGQGELSFGFANILLPDSTTNLAGSQGFVTFLVAQQPEVPLGTEIYNQAAIFFDYNAPVMTNKTLHTVGVDLLSSIAEIPTVKKLEAVLVSPNPAVDYTTFQLNKGDFKAHRLQLFDPLGKLVFETVVNGSQYVLPRNDFRAGAYGWRITDAGGQLAGSGIVVFQ